MKGKKYKFEEQIGSVYIGETNKWLDVLYKGDFEKYIEISKVSAEEDWIKMDLSIWRNDIIDTKYDKRWKTYRIYVKEFKGIRIAILPVTEFKIPKETEKVIIYGISK